MISIRLNDDSFRYDIYSLIKAFYPEAELNFDLINKENLDREPVIHWERRTVAPDKTDVAQVMGEVLIPSEYGERIELKNIVKRRLYKILSRESGRTLPWGTLTGIRPVKIPARELNKGKGREEILALMEECYLTSREKALLATEIACLQRNLMEGVSKGASLYVGIPFCPSICAYCSFSAYPLSAYRDKVEDYLLALKKELAFISGNLKKKLRSIYIGGGTPTTLSENQLYGLIDFIKAKFDFSEMKEFSVECGRPDSITPGKLKVIKEMGVDRICINPQTMNDKTLKLMGRSHRSEDIVRAFDMARDAGINWINTDLIAGLPGEGEDEVKYTLNKIRELNPENITVHSLAIKRSSRMNLEWEAKPVLEHADKIMSLFNNCAEELSMRPYYLYRQKQIAGNLENIGYAKGGYECLYNILIMGEYQDIISAGAGSVSKFPGEGKLKRVENVKDVDTYISRIDEMIERKRLWL